MKIPVIILIALFISISTMAQYDSTKYKYYEGQMKFYTDKADSIWCWVQTKKSRGENIPIEVLREKINIMVGFQRQSWEAHASMVWWSPELAESRRLDSIMSKK